MKTLTAFCIITQNFINEHMKKELLMLTFSVMQSGNNGNQVIIEQNCIVFVKTINLIGRQKIDLKGYLDLRSISLELSIYNYEIFRPLLSFRVVS